MGEEAKEDMGQKLQAPADFNGPMSNRGCTDILCLLLIIAMWAATTGIGVMGMSGGDYRIILYPMAIDGSICGADLTDKAGWETSSDMSDYPYLYPVNYYGAGVCVKKCPDFSPETLAAATQPAETLAYFTATIGEAGFKDSGSVGGNVPAEVFKASDLAPNYDGKDDRVNCAGTACYNFKDDYVRSGYGNGFPVISTSPFMNRCVLSSKSIDYMVATATGDAAVTKEKEENEEEAGFTTKLYADMWTAKAWILGFGFCVAVLVSFVYSFLLRIPGVLVILVWGCIAAVEGMFLGMAYYSYNEYEAWNTEDPQTRSDEEIKGMAGVAIFFAVLGGLWFLLTCCCLRSRIMLALEVVKASARAVAAMPLIIVFPVFQATGFILYMTLWMMYAVYLASMGEVDPGNYCFKDGAVNPAGITKELCDGVGGFWYTYRSFVYNDDQTNMGWFLLFSYFWTSQFIIAVGQIVVAMCISKWYFSRDKGVIGNATVISSVKDSMWYHTGTAAFGSLIIAIIKMIRAAVAYAQRKAKESGNKLAQAVLCAIQCFMWCMEKCMKFLNKNAYIQTAIFGTNFCSSAKAAFFLILRNVARIGACTMVSEFVIIIGKIFIMVITGGLSYMAMDQAIGEELNSPLGPVFFIMILSYFTASMFMNVFGMAIATILQCFVADEEMYSGAERFAEASLAKFIDDNGAPAKVEKKDEI